MIPVLAGLTSFLRADCAAIYFIVVGAFVVDLTFHGDIVNEIQDFVAYSHLLNPNDIFIWDKPKIPLRFVFQPFDFDSDSFFISHNSIPFCIYPKATSDNKYNGNPLDNSDKQIVRVCVKAAWDSQFRAFLAIVR